MNTRPISDSEWEAFAGASLFPNGDRPEYTGGRLQSGQEYCLVIDAEMASLTVDDEEQTEFGGWYAEFKPRTAVAARAILSGLGEPRTLQDFLDYGFQPA